MAYLPLDSAPDLANGEASAEAGGIPADRLPPDVTVGNDNEPALCVLPGPGTQVRAEAAGAAGKVIAHSLTGLVLAGLFVAVSILSATGKLTFALWLGLSLAVAAAAGVCCLGAVKERLPRGWLLGGGVMFVLAACRAPTVLPAGGVTLLVCVAALTGVMTGLPNKVWRTVGVAAVAAFAAVLLACLAQLVRHPELVAFHETGSALAVRTLPAQAMDWLTVFVLVASWPLAALCWQIGLRSAGAPHQNGRRARVIPLLVFGVLVIAASLLGGFVLPFTTLAVLTLGGAMFCLTYWNRKAAIVVFGVLAGLAILGLPIFVLSLAAPDGGAADAWRAAASHVFDSPVIGHGPGRARDLIGPAASNITLASGGIQVPVQNMVVEFWLDLGLLGVLAALVALGSLLAALGRPDIPPLAAAAGLAALTAGLVVAFSGASLWTPTFTSICAGAGLYCVLACRPVRRKRAPSSVGGTTGPVDLIVLLEQGRQIPDERLHQPQATFTKA